MLSIRRNKKQIGRQIGGDKNDTLEYYVNNGMVKTYKEYLEIPIETSHETPNLLYHYATNKIPYAFPPIKSQVMKIGNNVINSYITTRGDILLEQIGENACHATATIMLAMSKGFAIPDELANMCQTRNKSYGIGTYQLYAKMLNKDLVVKEFPHVRTKNIMTITDTEIDNIVDEIEIFVKQYGVCCISSSGHIKVVDDVIRDIKGNRYLIIRDPYAFSQFIYDTSPDANFQPFPVRWNHRMVMMITEVFSFR